MAIIYTYPPVTNPDGTELVVVSDTKNQNATRLMSIGQIAALVPSGAGGTVTSVTLDFDPLTTGDTGLRLAGGITSQTIIGAGTFDVGGTLYSDAWRYWSIGVSYSQGDILLLCSFSTYLRHYLDIIYRSVLVTVLTVSVANIPTWAVTPGGAAGTVTSVATTNTMGGTSGIGFAATRQIL